MRIELKTLISHNPLTHVPVGCSEILGHAAELAIQLRIDGKLFYKLMRFTSEENILAIMELFYLHIEYKWFDFETVLDYFNDLQNNRLPDIVLTKALELLGVRFKYSVKTVTKVPLRYVYEGYLLPTFKQIYDNVKLVYPRHVSYALSEKYYSTLSYLRFARISICDDRNMLNALEYLFKALGRNDLEDYVCLHREHVCGFHEYSNILYELQLLLSDIELYYIRNLGLPDFNDSLNTYLQDVDTILNGELY